MSPDFTKFIHSNSFQLSKTKACLAGGEATLLLCTSPLLQTTPSSRASCENTEYFFASSSEAGRSVTVRQSQRGSLTQLWRPSVGLRGTRLATLVAWETSPAPSQMLLHTLLVTELAPPSLGEHTAAADPGGTIKVTQVL